MTALPAARAMRTLTEAAAPALPNFVCFGAYKCGTTWLYQCLGEHPQVFLPHFKEIDFFQRKDGTRAYHSRGIGWYRALYADAGRAPLRGDISPGYLTDAEAPRLIAASLPGAKLLAMLRNPVERAVSHYRFLAAAGKLAHSLGELIERPELDRHGVIEAGFYARHLDRWGAAFGASDMRIVLMDDLARDPAETFRGVCEFLDIDPAFTPAALGRRVNPARELRSARLYQLNYDAAQFLTRHGLDRLRRLIKQTGLPARLAAWNVVPSAVGSAGPPVDAALRSRLEDIYRPDIERLSERLGRDLSHWLGEARASSFKTRRASGPAQAERNSRWELSDACTVRENSSSR